MSASILAVVVLILSAVTAVAAETTLDLDKEEPAPAQVQASAQGATPVATGPRLMGRVDLSYEISPWENPGRLVKDDTLKSYHFFVFLKAQASEKVSFIGEIVDRTYYQVDYRPSSLLALHFGKILVPFGDTRRFHHFYGGVQGFGAQGVLLPNIWADYGLSGEWSVAGGTLDTYVVNGFASASAATDPVLNGASDSATQAFGFRFARPIIPGLSGIVSAYTSQWQPGKPLYLLGGDLRADYGLFPGPASKLRILGGIASAEIFGAASGRFRKYGDFLELGTNALGFAEPFVRYGTYVNDSRQESTRDTQGLDLGAFLPIDVLKLMLEYQWNFEAVDERKNDLFRAMLTLDF